MTGAGLHDVYSMQGGIKAWNGMVAVGHPEMGMPYFSEADSIADLLSLAWSLEEGTKLFYESLIEWSKDNTTRDIFSLLKNAEKQHQKYLSTLYDEISEKRFESLEKHTENLLLEDDIGSVLEGGAKLGEAITWARSMAISEILEFSISLESKLYDLYIRLQRREKEKSSSRSKIFSVIAGEEKHHLEKLVELFESTIRK